MLQQLGAATEAQSWGIGSMLFFFVVFLFVLYRVVTGKREEHEAFARIPFDDGLNQNDTALAGADQPNEQRA